jgi:peptidoglycan hydrolase-like protein with peptidoglycan-binding domain
MRIRVAILLVAAAFLAGACGGGGGSETGSTDTGVASQTGTIETQPATTQETTGQTAPKVQVPVPKPGEAIGPQSPPDQVLLLQKALKELGYKVGKPDGTWGPKTQKAVQKFQKKHKLAADGLVGPKTAKAINKDLQQAAQGA